MFKKILSLSCLFCGSFLFSSEGTLPFYKETEHFQAYCLEQDFPDAQSMLQDLEQYLFQWNQDLFPVSFSTKVNLIIFPDIQSFHLKIFGKDALPDWLVCHEDKDHSISLVSPQNPGPMHTRGSIMKCGRLCLGWFLTNQKYDAKLPFWLGMGLSYYKSKIYSKDMVDQYLLNKNNEIEIPSLSQLEKHRDPAERSDLVASYILTEFLFDHYGREKALAVLDDYSSFEKILGISKEEFRQECARYFQPQAVEKDECLPSTPQVVIRAPTKEEEFKVIKKTLVGLERFRERGYPVQLPHHKDFDALYEELQLYPKRVAFLDESHFQTIFSTEIYSPSFYDKGLEIVTPYKARIEKAIEKLEYLNKNWGFKLLPKYSVLLTLYGVGGNYELKTGCIHLLTKPDGNFDPVWAFTTVIHEIVHIGIEENIVQKFKLTCWEKEYVVDSICALYLKDILPNLRRGSQRI